MLGDRGGLRRREVAIDDQRLDVELGGADHHVVELALAEHEPRVDAIAKLEDAVGDGDAGGARELGELPQAVLRVGERARFALLADVHEDRAAVLRLDGARARLPRELRLERLDERAEIDVGAADGQRPYLSIGQARLLGRERQRVAEHRVAHRAVVVHGHVVRKVERARLALGAQLDGRDEVEPQPHEIDEIVARERLVVEVRVHEAERAEAPRRRAEAADVGQHELGRVADDHELDLARAMHERADLPPRFARGLGERPHELRRRDLRERDAPPVDALEELRRLRAEARRVAVEFLHRAEGSVSLALLRRARAHVKYPGRSMAVLTELRDDDARRIGRLYGLEVASARGVPAGSVNSNFELTLARGSRVFLRVYEEQKAGAAAGGKWPSSRPPRVERRAHAASARARRRRLHRGARGQARRAVPVGRGRGDVPSARRRRPRVPCRRGARPRAQGRARSRQAAREEPLRNRARPRRPPRRRPWCRRD